MKKKILFITWDGPQTNYLESLFFPIFSGLQQKSNCRFHVVQFSWAEKEKQEQLAQLAKEKGISYTHFRISRKPHPMFGTLITLVKGVGFLKRYILQHGINTLMPRSTLPAMMVNFIPSSGLKVIFDADGLPLEERIDFSGLNTKGCQYQFLKKQETRMLRTADLVLTRSDKANRIHLRNIGEKFSSKFFKVSNGRDEFFFGLDSNTRERFRKKLGLVPKQLLMVYCGSLGPQYGWESMINLFEAIAKIKPKSRFLILTGEDAYLENRIPKTIDQQVTIIKGPYEDIPAWLNAADMAFAIREPMFSMQGVAPIKLGEYLLMGLPTIASKGIGDTEDLLGNKPFVHLFDHQKKGEVDKVLAWMEQQVFFDRLIIRQFAIKHFTLARSVSDYKNALESLMPIV
ncbi:MAG: glycosyltransferase [Anditalea sp.]